MHNTSMISSFHKNYLNRDNIFWTAISFPRFWTGAMLLGVSGKYSNSAFTALHTICRTSFKRLDRYCFSLGTRILLATHWFHHLKRLCNSYLCNSYDQAQPAWFLWSSQDKKMIVSSGKICLSKNGILLVALCVGKQKHVWNILKVLFRWQHLPVQYTLYSFHLAIFF